MAHDSIDAAVCVKDPHVLQSLYSVIQATSVTAVCYTACLPPLLSRESTARIVFCGSPGN